MNPLLGYQLERQIILLDEQQLQGLKHKLPAKETAATNDKSPGGPAETASLDSTLKVDKRGKKAERFNDGLALRMAHPKLIHPTPVVATIYSPILEAIDKLEILAQTMNLTSEVKVQPEEELKSVLPTPNCHEPQKTLHSPGFKPLPPSTAPSTLTLDEPEGTHQQNGLAAIYAITPSESAATVVAYPSKTTTSPYSCQPLTSSTLSTIASLFPPSATSSTRSHSSLLETYTDALAISSRLRTSSAATRENIIIGREDNAMCEELDNEHILNPTADNRHQKKQRVHMTGSDERNSVKSAGFMANPTTFAVVHSPSFSLLTSKPSPHNAASRPPMASRTLPFFKKRSSPYTHRSMAQSDSQIDHHGSYPTTATSNINKRQSGSVLASISSTFLGIRSSSRSRSYSSASSFALATTQTFSTLPNSTTTKQYSQASHIACVHPPPLPTNLVTNGSAKSPNARPFSHFLNAGHQYPMPTLSHSQSTPALLSDGQPNDCKEPFVLRRTVCACHNKQLSGSCLFHKKLPSLPAAPTGLIKEKKRSNRNSVMSTAASICSFVTSIKKSRSRADSAQSLAKLDASFSRGSQEQSQSDTTLPCLHPQEPVLNHRRLLTTARRRNRKEPTSVVRRAVKRHAAADVPLPASSALSRGNLGFQQAKCQAVYGFKQAKCQAVHGLKRRPLSPPYHSTEQSRTCAGQLYLYPMSASTPCLVQPVLFTSNKHLVQSMPTITRIRQASESTPNLSLHGGAQVAAVNAHAEIVVHPHIAGASATSSRSVNLITSFNADFPSIGRSRPLISAPSPVHSTGSYSKENATFFEPFQAHSKSRSGKSSNYVSFHFDLSHLEKAEHEDEDGSASITKANMWCKEQDDVDESDGGEDEDGMDSLRCVSSSPPAHLSTSLPNVTLSFRDLLPAHLRNRATLPPPSSPLHSSPQEVDQEDNSSVEDDIPFRTIHQHLRTATSTSASSSSLFRPSQPQSVQHHPLKRLLGYGKDKTEHRSHSESLSRAQKATNSSTLSLPAMLSSFLPFSASTASLPLHSNQTRLGTKARLAGRGPKPSGNKWNWMWWKNGNKSSNSGNGVAGQEERRK